MKAQGFLAKHDIQTNETVNSSKKLGADDALRLAKAAVSVIVSKGNNVDRFTMEKDAPADELLLTHMLGPTGNLRAPTIRYATTLLVGFNEEVYAETFLA